MPFTVRFRDQRGARRTGHARVVGGLNKGEGFREDNILPEPLVLVGYVGARLVHLLARLADDGMHRIDPEGGEAGRVGHPALDIL